MFTYIIESHGYYKIGRTVDVDKKLTTFNICNPVYELVHVIDFDCENHLHLIFSGREFKNDWFTISKDEIGWIKRNEEELRLISEKASSGLSADNELANNKLKELYRQANFMK